MTDLEAFKRWLNDGRRGYAITPGKRGAIVHHLNDLFGDEGARHAFLKWAFDVKSASDLSDTELRRIYEWLSPQPDPQTGEWTVRAQCQTTANDWLRANQVEAGQMELIGENE